jgi:alginate O-acetyltransferase complex protein AlgI
MVKVLEKQAHWNFPSVSALIILLSFRILFDFSGYSDIAIGLARMLGIQLPINFNFPYISRNISEFWSRWHISLSSWIRDYLYIPLGGGRVPLWRKIVNLTLVMALCGLLHGAALNFMLWGIYQGVGLGVHNIYEKWIGQPGSTLANYFRLPALVSWAFTVIFVSFGWLIFFYPVDQILQLTHALFHW